MLPRRHYREVARELAELNDPKAQAGVHAINELLEERARLALRVRKAESKSGVGCKPTKTKKKWTEFLWKLIS